MLYQQAIAALSLFSAAAAIESPTYTGYTRKWQANFIGPMNTQPPASDWTIVTGDKNDNNEFQRYTNSVANIRYSGTDALQIIPRKDATAPKGWTSGRIETKFTVTPEAGKITRIESSLRIAGNPAKNKQGLWPAFWLMGDSFRKGTPWPASGELDIFENINGQSEVVGVVHCGTYPGGICNEPIGLVNTTPLPDNKFHTYRLEFNRKSTNFKDQTITWYKDNVQFHRVTGTQINDAAVWATLAQAPMYLILNVAIGGNWPGPPNADTWDGTGNMLEVAYIAHYVST
ncbi:Beta-glucanase [Paramyrothecium foliicola]|nr:Beta-glucanase [Paramyrothecium foliicola]